MDTYDIGDQPTLVAKFTAPTDPADPDSTQAPTNTSTVTFTVFNKTTGVTLTMGAVANPTPGTYTSKCPVLATSGIYETRAVGTGTINAAVQSEFQVRPLNTT